VVVSPSPGTAGTLPRPERFDASWRTSLESLLDRGRAAGADLVEVFLERTDHLGVLAEQDAITSVSPSFGAGAGIRVFRGERDGFVSTNDLSAAGLQRALDVEAARLDRDGRVGEDQRRR
jgi:TldD protein